MTAYSLVKRCLIPGSDQGISLRHNVRLHGRCILSNGIGYYFLGNKVDRSVKQPQFHIVLRSTTHKDLSPRTLHAFTTRVVDTGATVT